MKPSNLSAREYHAQREAKQLRQREHLRQRQLTGTRKAIRQLAPRFPAIEAVYLFGSIVQPGRFTDHSDIDVAVKTNDVATESAFWRALEEALEWNVDVRPYQHPITQAVADYGECVYARESNHT
jgi:predicted nucleotidyltransferase